MGEKTKEGKILVDRELIKKLTKHVDNEYQWNIPTVFSYKGGNYKIIQILKSGGYIFRVM